MMTNNMEFVQRLKAARDYLHLSQEYVAKQMGLNRTSLVAIEAGTRKVTSEELRLFSEIYGWSVDELLYGNINEKKDMARLFARSFSELTEQDQREIIDFIEFKRMLKEKRNHNA
jgi:DNA-binding XRE family transcriptional regulator